LDLSIALAFPREEAPPVGRLFDRLLDPWRRATAQELKGPLALSAASRYLSRA
jgi:hypothetical protein